MTSDSAQVPATTSSQPMSTGGSTDDSSNVDPSDGSSTGTPPTDFCGNNAVENDEVCDGTDLADMSCADLGFDMGDLGCTGNCGGYDLTGCGPFVCGDGSQDGEEDCDGTVGMATCATQGFDNGTLFCTADCEYDFSMCGVCGDGTIDDGEECDTAKALPASCGSLGFMTGSLQCDDNCLFDTALCSTCGNDLTEGTEDCDGLDVPGLTCLEEGFDSGTLACQANCQYDFSACGTCGNSIADGDELCDENSFGADSCETLGFDSGTLTCSAGCDLVTTENCGVCGNGAIDGGEVCDGALLGGQTCALIGLEGGDLACGITCGFDTSGCDISALPFAVGGQANSGNLGPFFRGNGFVADANGSVVDFEVYMGFAAVCDVDFYVFEAPEPGGVLTQLVRTTVSAPVATGYINSGPINALVTNGMYYLLGIGWNCTATYYWDSMGWAGFDAGVGLFSDNRWDNAYPGASDLYTPPNSGGASTAYDQRISWAGP